MSSGNNNSVVVANRNEGGRGEPQPPNANGEVQNVRPDGGGGGGGGDGGDQQQLQPAQPQGRQFSFFQMIRGLVINGLIIYFITGFFRKPQPQSVGTELGGGGGADLTQRLPSENLFHNGTVFDMYVYVSERERFNDFRDPKCLVWNQEGLVYGDWYGGPNSDGTFVTERQIEASTKVQNNGTLYLHIYLVKHRYSPDPKDGDNYLKRYTIHKHRLINRYKRKRYQKTHNLLTGKTTLTEEEILKAEMQTEEIVSHWHPNVTINLIDDHTPWVKGSIPSPLDEFIEFDAETGNYYPIIYVNDYWNFMRDYQPINETTKVLNLTLTYQPLSLFRWQLYTAQNMRSRWTSSVLGEGMDDNEEDQDYLKEAFLETNPYLLAITIAVSILHSIFEFLAFKNDIQFWNNRKSLEGLSVRSVFFNVFQSLIVLLYVLDHETNTIVRVSVFVGLAIEIWKIHKVVNIEVNRENKIAGIIPRIWFSDKGSYVASSTRQYDIMAFRYLSWALYPLLIGYAVYSLLYLEHKGWYSWVLSMLYGFLLTFGFIMMTPQLFINYKLKSVAHLPWRMMTYKALNTFIDDIFAFVIKMPTMYRLGCFRDDIVFFIYLYQRWIYRVDPTRMNEFGTSGEMEQPAATPAITAATTPAITAATTPAITAATAAVENGPAKDGEGETSKSSQSKKSPKRKKDD